MRLLFSALFLCSCLHPCLGKAAGEPSSPSWATAGLNNYTNPRLLITNWENRALTPTANRVLSAATTRLWSQPIPYKALSRQPYDSAADASDRAFEDASIMSSLLVQDDGLIHVRSHDSYQNESPKASKAAGPSGWFAGTAAHPGPSEETFELGLALDAGIPAPLLVMLVVAGLGALWLLKRTLND